MRLSSDHDPKYLRLGLILVFTGFIFALIFVTRVNARELSPQIFDTESVLIYDNDPLSVFGCDHALYFYQDPLTDEILLSSSFNPEIEQLYDHWYGSQVMDSVRSWGFYYLSYEILKGHIINLMSRTNTFWIPWFDTISNVELKELVLDDSYEAFYFMDSNFNYYCYVSYIPVNSETVQPVYPFDSFTINDSGHFVEQDPLYRELFVWDLSNQRWIYSSVSSSEVVVHTVLRSPSGVRLESGAQVYVQSSRFLIDDPLPSATPSPTSSSSPDPAFSVIIKNKDNYYLYDVFGSYKSVSNQSLLVSGSSNNALSYVMSTYGTDNVFSHFVWFAKGQIYSSRPYYGNNGFLYFPSDGIDHINSYSLGTSLVSLDLDFLRSNFDSSLYSSDYYSFSSELSLGCIVFNNFSGYSVELIYGENLSNLNLVSTSNIPELNTSNGLFNYSSNSSSNLLVQAYRFGLGGASSVSPTPDPNAPSPTPTPTEAPHVIITWPTGTPTPTPPFVIPSMPPLNPPGDGITPLDPELQEDVFGVFKSKIGDNNSFGLFGLLIGLLPGDLMWYIWFLLFVLLVVGVAKLIIHFTGG